MWAALVIMTVLPAVALAVVLGALGDLDASPHWRTHVADRLEVAADRLRGHAPVRPPDPFVALRVQQRLGVVASHVQRLEADTTVIARAERIIASQLAYDYLLEEACSMAGVEIPPHAKGDPVERFREEVELASRGWAW